MAEREPCELRVLLLLAQAGAGDMQDHGDKQELGLQETKAGKETAPETGIPPEAVSLRDSPSTCGLTYQVPGQRVGRDVWTVRVKAGLEGSWSLRGLCVMSVIYSE